MALARLNIPGLVLYGGSIAPGHGSRGATSPSRTSSRRSARTPPAGCPTPSSAQLEDRACPGAGACGGQFTANTMATACEFARHLGAIGSGSVPATDPGKAGGRRERRRAGRWSVLKRGVRPREIITRDALENAIASVAATGGSTNAVLHLLAIAREAGVALDLDDFDRISARTPLLADLKPGGRFVATDLHRAGGSPARRQPPARRRRRSTPARRPSAAGRLARKPTPPSRPPARRSSGRSATRSSRRGGLVILRGNLAPDGCVVKVAGHDYGTFTRTGAGLRQRGGRLRGGAAPAASTPATSSSSATRDRRGGPGMREMLGVTGGNCRRRTRRLRRARHRRALLRRDARPDGRPRRPRSGAGGPIAAVRDGDTIAFDLPARTLRVELDAATIAARARRLARRRRRALRPA